MQITGTVDAVDFENRLRRSQGRTARKIVASAKVTEAERGELDAAAKAQGKALSEWAREVLLVEARRSSELTVQTRDIVLTEVVAMRMMLNNISRVVCLGSTITAEVLNEQAVQIRAAKHQVTREVRQQYADRIGKEA